MSINIPSSDSSLRDFRDAATADRWLNRAVARSTARFTSASPDRASDDPAVRVQFSPSALRLAAMAAIEAAAAQAKTPAATEEDDAGNGSGNPLSFDEKDATETTDEAEPSTGALKFADTAAAAPSTPFTDNFATTENWVSTSGGALSSGDGTFYPNPSGGYGSVETKQTFAGAFELKFDLYLPGAYDSLDVTLGGATLSRLADSSNTTKWGWHSVRIAYDGAGNAATYLDGADTAADTQSGIDPQAAGHLGLANYGEGSARLQNFSLTPVAGGAVPATEQDAAGSGDEITATTSDEAESAGAAELADQAGGIVADTETEPLADGAAAEEATDVAREQILQESGNAIVTQANVDEWTAFALLTSGEPAAA